jgi:predicted component of type VI protein secretion system
MVLLAIGGLGIGALVLLGSAVSSVIGGLMQRSTVSAQGEQQAKAARQQAAMMRQQQKEAERTARMQAASEQDTQARMAKSMQESATEARETQQKDMLDARMAQMLMGTTAPQGAMPPGIQDSVIQQAAQAPNSMYAALLRSGIDPAMLG